MSKFTQPIATVHTSNRLTAVAVQWVGKSQQIKGVPLNKNEKRKNTYYNGKTKIVLYTII